MTEFAEYRNIDLSRETLRIFSCGTCRALVMTEHYDEHMTWHAGNDEGRA